MPAKLEWPEYPEGVRVFWKGLEFEKVVPFEPDEAPRAADESVDRLQLSGIMFGIFGAIFLVFIGASIWLWSIYAALTVFVGYLLARAGNNQPKCRTRGVFTGKLDSMSAPGAVLRLVDKHGLDTKNLHVEILPNGYLWAVNGHRVKWNAFLAWPTVISCLSQPVDLMLSEADKAELYGAYKKRLSGSAIVPIVFAQMVWTVFISDIPAVKNSSWLGLKLFGFIAYLGIMVLTIQLATTPASRLYKDSQEGILVQEGNSLVLKYSRKPWIVDVKPAEWRLKGLTNENRRSLEEAMRQSSSLR